MANPRGPAAVLAVIAAELMEEEVDDEEEQNMIDEARVAVLQIMEMEEGEVISMTLFFDFL